MDNRGPLPPRTISAGEPEWGGARARAPAAPDDPPTAEMETRLMVGWKSRVPLRWKIHALYCLNRVGRLGEILRYLFVAPKENKRFHVVSCERHAREAAARCLDSVYIQDYDRRLVRHVFIDDASEDETPRVVEEWLAEHPDHNVEYIRNSQRMGGCANTLRGYRTAPPGSVVMEMNGDDWFPDPGVMAFLSKVYADDDVWMTCNSRVLADGAFWSLSRPYPKRVVERNAFRDARWFGGALQTFRSELLRYVDEEKSLIDPKTGEYWANADDLAFFLCLFELCGRHARHLYRINYVYNLRSESEGNVDPGGPAERTRRIRLAPRHRPLERL